MCCFGNADDDANDDGDIGGFVLFNDESDGAEGQKLNIRLVPSYDEDGNYDDWENTLHLCRYLFPWPAARFCTHTLGLLDCGIRVTLPRAVARMCGRGAGRNKRGGCSCLMFLLVAVFLLTAYIAWAARSDLHAVVESPCYVCDHTKARYRHLSPTKSRSWREGAGAMDRYGMFVHGVSCALDASMVKALEEEQTRWALYSNHKKSDHNRSRSEDSPTTTALPCVPSVPWTRYSRYVGVGLRDDEASSKRSGENRDEDWRNAIPRLWVMGFRGSGTTSLAHYLDAHPDIEVRRQVLEAGAGTGESSVPWDDHFFAEIPYWDPAEIRAWMRRGWGEPTMADHQGVGKTRVEVGPDYLWRASSGSAGAVRRAVSNAPEASNFLIVLSDPVRLVREAHQRAVDSGAEPRTSFAQVVAEELPHLAKCLWFGDAGPEEQAQRVVEGQCGGGEPGRIGAPYLWRGLQAPYVHHWMRTATPGRYGKWYAIRSEDLMQYPNATLNRALNQFAGLPLHDFGPVIERVWRPDSAVAKSLAPKATWVHSWRAQLPRAEYLNQVRKDAADRLLDSAQRAAKRWVPGLEAGLKTAEKLRRLHCRLSGFTDPSVVATQECLSAGSGGNGKRQRVGGRGRKHGDEDQKRREEEERTKREEEEALDALRDFYAPDQERLMYLLDATDQDRLFRKHQHQQKINEFGGGVEKQKQKDDVDMDEKLREFYLKQRY